MKKCIEISCENSANHGKRCRKHYSFNYRQTKAGQKRDKSYRTGTRKLTDKEYRQEIKALCIAHYSNDTNMCNCCGEYRMEFLTLDHVNNDGAQHRRETKRTNIYMWLKARNYPKEPQLQVLCMNCNFAKKDGDCPHTKEVTRRAG